MPEEVKLYSQVFPEGSRSAPDTLGQVSAAAAGGAEATSATTANVNVAATTLEAVSTLRPRFAPIADRP